MDDVSGLDRSNELYDVVDLPVVREGRLKIKEITHWVIAFGQGMERCE